MVSGCFGGEYAVDCRGSGFCIGTRGRVVGFIGRSRQGDLAQEIADGRYIGSGDLARADLGGRRIIIDVIAGGVLRVWDPKTGKLMNVVQLAEGFLIAPVIADRKIFLLSTDMGIDCTGSQETKIIGDQRGSKLWVI